MREITEERDIQERMRLCAGFHDSCIVSAPIASQYTTASGAMRTELPPQRRRISFFGSRRFTYLSSTENSFSRSKISYSATAPISSICDMCAVSGERGCALTGEKAFLFLGVFTGIKLSLSDQTISLSSRHLPSRSL